MFDWFNLGVCLSATAGIGLFGVGYHAFVWMRDYRIRVERKGN